MRAEEGGTDGSPVEVRFDRSYQLSDAEVAAQRQAAEEHRADDERLRRRLALEQRLARLRGRDGIEVATRRCGTTTSTPPRQRSPRSATNSDEREEHHRGEQPGAHDRHPAGARRAARRRIGKLVSRKLSVGDLRDRFEQFLEKLRTMTEVDAADTDRFHLAEIHFAAEISADGEFKLMGTGVGVEAKSGVTFVLHRRP